MVQNLNIFSSKMQIKINVDFMKKIYFFKKVTFLLKYLDVLKLKDNYGL